MLLPVGGLVLRGGHGLVVSENVVLSPLAVKTVAERRSTDDLGTRVVEVMLVPLVAPVVELIKGVLMLLLITVVELAQRHH